MSSFKNSLTQLYIGYFGRAPQLSELAFWEAVLQEGGTLEKAAQEFAAQSKALAQYPYMGDPSAQDIETFLDAVYQNLFGRTADIKGLSFWSDQIENGLPPGMAILEIIAGAVAADREALARKAASVVSTSDDQAKVAAGSTVMTKTEAFSTNTLANEQDVARVSDNGKTRADMQEAMVELAASTAPIELSDVEMSSDPRGFVINGESTLDLAGTSASSAGDVNGDGFEDLIVGVPASDRNGFIAGASFVVFGKTDGGVVEVSDVGLAANPSGFLINGATTGDYSGVSVSDAGDLNGDGLTDLLVGANFADPNGNYSGASFVVFGKTDGGVVELSDIASATNSNGFVINGASADDWSGLSVSSAKDVNGDGLDDLIIGASRADPNGSTSGSSFVVFGKSDGSSVELSDIALGAGGFVIHGVGPGDFSGYSVNEAHDVNGDGLDDVIIGAIRDDPNGGNSGASFVIFGKTDGAAIELSNVQQGTNNSGFAINGVSAGDLSGASVSGAGDVNGDGLADLIIGAGFDDPNGINSGATFVIFGKTNGSVVQLSNIQLGTNANGFIINGVSAQDEMGFSVSGAGDVNGDGLADLIMGAEQDDPNGNASGASFLVFGKTDGSVVELSDVQAGTGGFVINGASAGDRAGAFVSSAGDVNGDGFADLIISSVQDDPNALDAGASFVLFGGDFNAVTTAIGTTLNDTLTGSSAVDRIVAGTGDDVLPGNGGADVLRGGAGDDIMGVTDMTFADIEGGTGSDTLRLDAGALTLDLTVLDNTSLTGIERIDLNANGNALIVDKIEVQRLSEYSNTLRVLGDASDTVTVADSGWTFAGTGVDADGPFNIYTNGRARLEVPTTITVIGVPIAAIELSAVELNSDARGFVINGTPAGTYSGGFVSSAGDVNGDGLEDLIIGAAANDPNGLSSGTSFVVFGKTGGAAVELSDVEAGVGGFAINGVSAYDFSGVSISSAGDMNDDGLTDLLVGALFDDPNGTDSGAAFVIFGKTDGAAVELSDVSSGANNSGFAINGVASGDWTGMVSSGTGDVNGDGFTDVIIGAHRHDQNGTDSGASFVVFGKSDGSVVELSDVETGTGGFVINGVSANDFSGYAVSGAGDVNGDGLDDLFVASEQDAPNGVLSGASFVVFGKTDGTAVELSDVELGTNNSGFVINGVSAGDNSGRSVSDAGDVNGDGLADLIVGAYRDDPNGAGSGASFVVFGKTDGGAVELSDVEAGTGGFVINGASAYDNSARAVSSAGDVNGDGFDDLIIGAEQDDPNGSNTGASFVVFGGDFNGVTTAIGSTLNDTLTGSSAVDRIVAGTGDDVLIGGGGADVLRGGAGNDVIAVNDLSFADIEGGTGSDTLRLDATTLTLDLGALDNTSLTGIERIDLSASGNTLIVDKIEVQRLSEYSNTLRVLGDATDTITVTDPGWTFVGTGSDADGPFDIFVNGQARLEVPTTIMLGGGLVRPITPIQLSDVQMNTDDSGFVINGVGQNDLSGWSVSNAGDVNGDGFDDLIVGAPSDDPNGSNSGASFVVFGKTDGGIVNLSDVETGVGGFVIKGVSAGNTAGTSVSGAGDVNGDGLDDLFVGAPRDNAGIWAFGGVSFVVFGKTDTSAVELSNVEAGNNNSGFAINGVFANDWSGFSVSDAGDINGDGLDDLIVGAYKNDVNGSDSGASYVVFGKSDGSIVSLTDVEINSNNSGFAINGIGQNDESGRFVSGAGDVNGDGFADVIVGASRDDPNGGDSGASFVVFGKTDGSIIELSDIENSANNSGFVINGVGQNDRSGFAVSDAGDVNGDGFDDLIVGAYLDDPNSSNSGASFVVFGKTDGSAVELSDVELGANTSGFAINGVSANDWSGFSVSGAGDVNGDGFDDLIVGAREDDPNGSGSGVGFVVFGKTDGNVVELSDVDAGIGGVALLGVASNDKAGYSVSGAGDVNGDGFDDLIVGALRDDPNGIDSGASFVVFGGNFTGSATQVGTTGADTITGTTADDNIFAGTGNDTIQNSAGQDRISGGNGADEFDFLNFTGQTTLIDFVSAEGDQMDVSAFGFANFAALQATFSANGPGGHDTLIQLDADTSVVVIGLQTGDLMVGDFIL